MATYIWSIEDEGATGAIWSYQIEIDNDGRGLTLSRDPVWTSLADARTSSTAVTLVDRATGTTVNTGATWNDLARPVRLSWPAYGREVDLRLWGRTSGVWGRPAGLPAGQPAGVTGGTEAARFEIGQAGTLRPISGPQQDWIVDDRPIQRAAAPPIRYTTVEDVKTALRVPTDPQARGWATGEFTNLLVQAIRAAESQVDLHCGRRFDAAGSQAEERTYRRRGQFHTDTDDWVGSAAVVEDDIPVADADWWTEPVNSLHPSVQRGINFSTPDRSSSSPWYLTGDYEAWQGTRTDIAVLPPLKVTARWGWDRTPDAVSYAVNLIAGRLWRRYDKAAMGMVMTEYGGSYLPRFDPDVEASLAPYRLLTGV